MANRNNQHIYSPPLVEYAYRALKNAHADDKRNMSSEELQIFNSDYTLQKFCKEERIDYVMYMLAKIGISWTLRLEEDAFAADMVEFNAADQHLYPHKKNDLIEATIREGVVVISSRDVMNLSHMTAQNCTTNVYTISQFNKDLAKVGKDVNQLKGWDNEIEGVQQAHDLFNDILLEQLNAFVYAEEVLMLKPSELRVLCALYSKRQISLTMTQIAEITKATGKKMYFRQHIQRLLDLGLVASDVSSIKKTWANSSYFTITTKGIDRVMDYRKYVLKNVFSK